MQARVGLSCGLVAFSVAVSGCLPPPLKDCSKGDCSDTSSGESGASTGEATVPTTGGEAEGETTEAATTGTSTGGESGGSTVGEEVPPLIDDVVVDPNPVFVNGVIAVDVVALHADGVRMVLDDGTLVELVGDGGGGFEGSIPAFTGLDNGDHVATLTPWRGGLEGPSVAAPYTIHLLPPGSEGFWKIGEAPEGGVVAAVGVLPDGQLVEFGNDFVQGEPRCFLRRRDGHGGWTTSERVPVLESSHCTAIDMKIDPVVGTLHLLLMRKGVDEPRWWLGEVAAWGKGAKQVGVGKVGETAEAIGWRSGEVAVCGGVTAKTLDLDAAVWLHRVGEDSELRQFDFDKGEGGPHQFDDTARDCVYAGKTLVLVGETFGLHSKGKGDPKRDRRFIVEHDTLAKTAAWTVGGGPGPGTQSRALAVALDDDGRYLLAGYTCGDLCERDAEIRVYEPGGAFVRQVPLGPLSMDAGPHDIAWSPAGYMVVALADTTGQVPRFKVQAFAAGGDVPLWTYLPEDMSGLQVARSLAIGRFGEVYAGGVGDGDHPAVAHVGG